MAQKVWMVMRKVHFNHHKLQSMLSKSLLDPILMKSLMHAPCMQTFGGNGYWLYKFFMDFRVIWEWWNFELMKIGKLALLLSEFLCFAFLALINFGSFKLFTFKNHWKFAVTFYEILWLFLLLDIFMSCGLNNDFKFF